MIDEHSNVEGDMLLTTAVLSLPEATGFGIVNLFL